MKVSVLRRWRRAGNLFAYLSIEGKNAVGVLDFTRNRYLGVEGTTQTPSDIVTYSDGSSKTMFDATGTLVTVAQGTPRYNSHVYRNGAWVNEGLQIEPEARTNLITDSNDNTTFSIGNTNSLTLTQDQKAGPDGNLNLVLCETTDTTSESHFVFKIFDGTVLQDYCVSAVLSDAGTRYVTMSITDANESYVSATFDLQSGSVESTGVGSTAGTISGSGIEPLGNGLYRCHVSGTTQVDATMPVFIGTSNSATPVLGSRGIPAYAGTAGLGFYTGFLQAEAGSTPSSYMPTNGSAVTRAAEALAIEPENNPLLERGPELVTNGTDWTGATGTTPPDGWTSDGVASFTLDNGTLTISRNAGPGNGILSQDITTEIGQSYSVVLSAGGRTVGNARILGIAGSTDVTVPQNTVGIMYFTANSTTSSLQIQAAASSGAVVDIDNISVKSLSMPTALSIAIKGGITYADTGQGTSGGGQGGEVVFASWLTGGGTDYIETALSTATARTGEMVFHQRSSAGLGAEIKVDSADDIYSPGVNVLFNIASYHSTGPVGINGAVDGAALTANTTPTALPDLTTADLQIMPVGDGGYISHIILYAAGLGDIGLEELTLL